MKEIFWLIMFLILSVVASAQTYISSDIFSISEDLKLTKIELNKPFDVSRNIPLDINVPITSFGVSVNGSLLNNRGYVRFILIDNNFNEYLIYEVAYPFYDSHFLLDNICDETCYFEDVVPLTLIIEIHDAIVNVDEIVFSEEIPKVIKEELREAQQTGKINNLNKIIKQKNLKWIAGETPISKMSYEEKKRLFTNPDGSPVDELPNLQGFEYYKGGIFEIGTRNASQNTSSDIPIKWDWRNIHGQNWLTSVKHQGSAGTCWAHSLMGALESQINLYYNQHIDVDLSEQMQVDCANLGPIEELSTRPENCTGNNSCYPGYNYCKIMYLGIADEECDPYANRSYTYNPSVCDYDHICLDWQDRVWKLHDFHDYKFGSDRGTPNCPKQTMDLPEDEFKQILVEKGPLDSSITSWSHAMVLVGYDGYDDWTTLNYCNRYIEYCTDLGCIRKDDLCEPIGAKICTGYYIYVCNSSNQWEVDSYCSGSKMCIHNQCIEPTNLTEGDIRCKSYLRQEYTPGNGDSYWIFKNSWGSNWGENGYGRISASLENMGWGSLPIGPFTPPLNQSYQINCVDNDNDSYCNWGISEEMPVTCSLSCNEEPDCDDSNNNSFYFGAEEICDDGHDNDCNGLIDINDPDCKIESFNITLIQGWNLISIPLNLKNTTIENVSKNIDFSSIFTQGSWLYYINETNNNFNSINETKGYWINSLTNQTLTIEGIKFSSINISLKQGNNLISYTSLEEQDISIVFNDINDSLINVLSYENNTWFSYNPFKNQNSLEIMKPGYGYWVNVNENITLEMP